MPALYIACPWFSISVEILFPQHHTALQLQVTSGTKVFIQTYFSAGLKYFQNAFLCSDTVSLSLAQRNNFNFKFGLPNKILTIEPQT